MKGYRTLTVNVLSMAIPIMELTEWQDVLPQNWLPWYILGLALANVWLRAITTGPMGTKK